MTDNKADGKEQSEPTLDELRQRIDTIDESIHRHLIERSEIVQALIAVKRTHKPGAALSAGTRNGHDAPSGRSSSWYFTHHNR